MPIYIASVWFQRLLPNGDPIIQPIPRVMREEADDKDAFKEKVRLRAANLDYDNVEFGLIGISRMSSDV